MIAAPGEPTGDPPRLGPYVLIRQIGEGGMGVVHLAQAPSGDRVAVKVLRPQVAGDAVGRARLTREVETLRRVSGERVAAVLDADVLGPVPYLVTRFVDGPSLDEVVCTGGALTEDAVLHLAWGLADALCVIHDAGVVHRDLKPSNVLLERGEPVVIDFGIAQVADDARLTASGVFIGTPGFLAPEIVAGGVGGPASDLHAWAGTVAFAATGRPPFGRGPMEVVLYNVSRGAADLDGVPDRLGPLVRGALAADPDDRISAHELRDRLSALLGAGVGERPTTIVLPVGVPATRAHAVPPATRAYDIPAATRTFDIPSATRVHAGASNGSFPGPAPLAPTQPGPPRHGPAAAYGSPVPPVPLPPALLPPAPPARPDPYAPPPSTRSPQPGAPTPPPASAARARPTVSLAALVFVAALAAVAPYVALGLLVAGTVLARLVDREAQSLAWRRSQRGARGTDALIAVVAAPWHLGVSILVGALTLPVAALLAALCLTPVLVLLVEPAQATLLAWSGALLTGWVWWGPGGRSVRRGTRRTLATLAPTPVAGAVLVALLGVAALGLALAASSGSISWLPFQGPPSWWDLADWAPGGWNPGGWNPADWNPGDTVAQLFEDLVGRRAG